MAQVKQADVEQSKFVWEWGGGEARTVLALPALMERGWIAAVRDLKKPPAPNTKNALDLVDLNDGHTIWTVPLSGDISAMNLVGDVMVVQLFRCVAGVSVIDGKPLWELPLEGMMNTGWSKDAFFQQGTWFAEKGIASQGIGGAFLSAKDKLYTCVSGIVYCLQPETGKVVWQQKAGFNLSSPLAFWKSVLLVPIGEELGGLDLDSGKVLWESGIDNPTQLRVVDDDVYVTPSQGLARVDPETGKALWGPGPRTDAGDLFTIAGDKLIVTSTGGCYILKRDTGEVLFQGNSSGKWAATDGDNLYLVPQGQGNTVACVSVADQQVKWQSEFDDIILCRLGVVGDRVLAIGWGQVVAYDKATGAEVWSWEPEGGGTIKDVTWTHDGSSAYFQHGDWVYGFDVRSGEQTFLIGGQFFFVDWMKWFKGSIYMHGCGGGGCIGGAKAGPAAA